MKQRFLLALLSIFSIAAMAQDATFDFSQQGYQNQEQLTSGIIDADNNTIWEASKGTGTVAPAYYDYGTALRIYGGGTFTISSDKKIAKIVLTLDMSSDKAGSFDQEAEQEPNEKSFTFTRAVGTGHVRVQKIKVTYAVEYLSVAEVMQVYNTLGLARGATSELPYMVRGYVTKWKSGYPTYQNADL